MFNVTEILRQETGRFDRRFRVGPVAWDFWDLLWLHEGRLALAFGAQAETMELAAPNGILIPPGTHFRGSAVGGAAIASITHFTSTLVGHDVLHVREQDRMHVRNLIQLSLDYAQRAEPMERRIRLLTAVLDCFGGADRASLHHATRLDRAWREATAKLADVRGITDVAAFAGLAESSFRTAHRAQFGASAGKHLQQLRLSEAERHLATTGFSLAEIAALVGYAHAETLATAFKRARGRTPGDYRYWCKRFA